jgi:hypothetical protein
LSKAGFGLLRIVAKAVALNERDREAAEDWMRDHLLDPASPPWRPRRTKATRSRTAVVYKVAVKDGKVLCGFTVVLKIGSYCPSDRSLDSPA